MFSIPNKGDNKQPEVQTIPKEKCTPNNSFENKVNLEEIVKRLQAIRRGCYVRRILEQQSVLLKVTIIKL